MHRRVEALERDQRRVDVRRLGVVDVEHAVDRRPTSSRRCSTPGNVRSPARTASAVTPRARHDGRRGHRVAAVVRPAQARSRRREQRLVAPPQRAGAARARPGPVAEADAPRAAAEVLDAEAERRDGDVVVALVGEHPQLGRAVGLERAVAVEVVGRDVEQDRRLGREHAACPRAGTTTPRRRRSPPGRASPTSELSGVPTLPATATGSPASRWMWPISSVVVVLPLVPGDRDEPVRQQPPRELELAEHRHAPLARGARSPAPARGTPGRLDHRARRRSSSSSAVGAGATPAIARGASGAPASTPRPLAARRSSASAREARARQPDDELRAGRAAAGAASSRSTAGRS